MGLTFKENCPDLRNTKVTDIIDELAEHGVKIDIYDPWVDENVAQMEYRLTMTTDPQQNTYDAIVIAVAHDKFKTLGANKISSFASNVHVIYDLKYLLDKDSSNLRL